LRKEWLRAEATVMLWQAEQAERSGMSERGVARAMGVARSTLRHWKARKASLDSDPGLVVFFESPTGLAFLHRLVMAAHFVFLQLGPCGVDLLCKFLELAGLTPFVAGSHGTHSAIKVAMEGEIVAFGAGEEARLAEGMREREIVLAEDENFHEGVCLVSMNPASGYIITETLAENREAETWTTVLRAALAGLKVRVVAAASDEAGGLIRHIEQGLGAVQLPDLFHMQRELWKALSRPLAAGLKAPAKALAKAEAVTADCRRRQAAYAAGKRPVGRPPNFQKHIAAAEAAEAAARAAYEATEARQAATHAAIRAIGDAYHPVDPQTGQLRVAASVEADLRTAFATIDANAEAIGLSEKQRSRIDKARRVLPKMVAAIAFFFAHLQRCLTELSLGDEAGALVREALIPGLYLATLANRAPTVADRQRLRAVSGTLLERARDPAGPLAQLPDALRREVELIAADCVNIFVRATSCVEGRNGRWALLHHCLHRITPTKRAALSVIHNYFIQRSDGSTAAKRFFEADHADLFLVSSQ
jgi:hypothetical protein